MLTKFLVYESHKTKIREDRPGIKSPLVMRTIFHEDLTDFFVSTSSGELLHRGNAEDGVPSAFFALEPRDEVNYMPYVFNRIYAQGCALDWGNVVHIADFTDQDFGDYLSFFHEYDLEMEQVFCGLAGYNALVRSNRLGHPSRQSLVDVEMSDEEVLAIQDEFLCAGFLHQRPVFYSKWIGPFIAFSSSPASVGLLNRTGDYVSVVIHNAERGLILAKLDQPFTDLEDDDTNEE